MYGEGVSRARQLGKRALDCVPGWRVTTSTQSGVYPVLLFREDMSGVYMAVAQGTQTHEATGPSVHAG